jgi:hypothetical protein
LILVGQVFCSRVEEDNRTPLPARTVIVYMIADNNLDNSALKDINEMEAGWQDDLNGNLLVYVDRATGATPAHPVVYKIVPDTTDNIVSPIVKVYQERNSADADNMHQVLSDIISDFQAQSYGLILWSHGTAWLPEGATMNSESLRAFGKDSDREMNIFDLKKAFPYHFDFIIFDACYMGSVEVVYELRNCTDFILSSATEILSGGYPYRETVRLLFDKLPDYSKIAETFFQFYASQSDMMQSVSVSVTRTDQLPCLATAVRQIMEDAAQIQTINYTSLQQLTTSENNTLFDLEQFVLQLSIDTYFLHEFKKILPDAIIYKACTKTISDNLHINTFSGLSIFIPTTNNTQYHEFYKKLDWYKDCSYINYFNKFVLGN